MIGCNRKLDAIYYRDLRISLSTHFMYYYYYDSTALRWVLAAFLAFSSYTQSVGFLGRGISPSQGLFLHTEQYKHRINELNTDFHALSGIRAHDPSVRASEDISCLRLRDQCVRPTSYYITLK
jgi:hypothetical protein